MWQKVMMKVKMCMKTYDKIMIWQNTKIKPWVLAKIEDENDAVA